jgi:hypothetical protein
VVLTEAGAVASPFRLAQPVGTGWHRIGDPAETIFNSLI